jgi:GrpB-like predicted nucleotidyltransferase (UPF0157 family)
MNTLAFKHSERLGFAAQRIARDIAAMRLELGLKNLYPELYAAREARLSAVTRARAAFNRWLRANPNCSTRAVKAALAELEIPLTREELTTAIRAIERKAVAQVRWEKNGRSES